MGLFRKTLFVATGGMSGAVGIKANSKKERIAKASEKQVRLMQGKPVGLNRVFGTPPQPMRVQPTAAPMSTLGMPSTVQSAPALAIAEERYARGEITREEFLQLKEDLGAKTPSAPLDPTGRAADSRGYEIPTPPETTTHRIENAAAGARRVELRVPPETAFQRVQSAMLAIGQIESTNRETRSIAGNSRYGLNKVRLDVSVFAGLDASTSVLHIQRRGLAISDPSGEALRKIIDRFLRALDASPLGGPRPPEQTR